MQISKELRDRLHKAVRDAFYTPGYIPGTCIINEWWERVTEALLHELHKAELLHPASNEPATTPTRES